ncbi:App1 family protein [Arthrobacter sp. L77]|uniref:App1 family protein n=1 Tax=Arthrobacter sp. L77 TaxID=1496689 RepID=UPI00068DE422|nr:phosphatase domain-containing protein [Arthrobacter sp. L77]
MSHFRQDAITVAYRTETGVRDRLARRAVEKGWTPAVIPYSGYASAQHSRVLGRVVLAPASVDPAARRGISGWRRLFTLESPGTEVQIEVQGTRTTVTTNEAGIIDARLPLDTPLPPGTTDAVLQVTGRAPVTATVHSAAAHPGRGVVCDIDDTVWITGIAHPARAAWRTLRGSSATRTSVPGMAHLLRTAVEGQDHPAVVYLSNGPWNFVGPVTRFLERNDFPAGAVLMTDWGITPNRWFRDGKKHKSSSLATLIDDLSHITWVLVGDDGEHDPTIYAELAETHPDRVAAIALRQVRPTPSTRTTEITAAAGAEPDADLINGVPVLRGADGDTLLPLLRDALDQTPTPTS